MKLIFMKPIYKDYIWGGNKIKSDLKKDTPYENTAESWEISANQNGDCIILNEEYNGMTLSNLFSREDIKTDIFGNVCKNMNEFPLLVKFIDARDNLSIQVHPDDDYAQNILKQPYGKNEMWYIMDCDEGTQLIGGMTDKFSKEKLTDIVQNNQIKNYLNYVDVKKGDSIYIAAGTLHAILKNNLICEIQQNSDVTYRVYDWDRVGKDGKTRQLHKTESIETIKTEIIPEVVHQDIDKKIQTIAKNQYFQVDKINCIDGFNDESIPESCYIINVVDGKGKIESITESFLIEKGNSFIIPATYGKYKISGNIELLRTKIN